jgi:hypothetical protein
MFCRPKNRYRIFEGDILDTGESRRIARISHPSLWEEWKPVPQAILTPDEIDARENFNAFYGMPVRYHAGIYWGALWCFRFNDNIFTEPAFSRDGFDFDRLPDRPKMLPLGEDGTWDDSMTFGSMDWLEVGDEWWFYYSGWDGDHGGKDRNAAIGLAKGRKEGLVSLRGPRGGGVVVTRLLKWPGGKLLAQRRRREGRAQGARERCHAQNHPRLRSHRLRALHRRLHRARDASGAARPSTHSLEKSCASSSSSVRPICSPSARIHRSDDPRARLLKP